MHPGIAEQLTVQRIREMNWRDRQLASGVMPRRAHKARGGAEVVACPVGPLARARVGYCRPPRPERGLAERHLRPVAGTRPCAPAEGISFFDNAHPST